VSRRKLLLADDSVTIQKVVNLTFADEGIEVFAVSDGIEAIDRLLEIAPDLVMADVNMPGINGYRVCERIKQHEKFRNTPVILLVGSFEPFDEEEARRVGADDYLTKPFQSIRQLVSKVSELLERSAARNDAGAPTSLENSFAETREMPVIEAEVIDREDEQDEAPPQRYEDAGIDDEMIQTSPAAGFVYDEAQKFSVGNYVEPREEDYGEAQSPTDDDLRESEAAATAGTASATGGYVSASQQEDSAAQPQQQTYQDEISQQPQTAQAFESNADDDDFLELFDDDEYEDDEEEEAAENIQPEPAETASANEVSAESPALVSETENYQATEEAESVQTSEESFVVQPIEAETVESAEARSSQSAETENTYRAEHAESFQPAAETQIAEASETGSGNQTAESFQSNEAEAMAASALSSQPQPQSPQSQYQLSPEMIDAIAQRVIEKLSETAVKEIAWEVVPQQADLIIKKMVEEKLKE